MADLETKLASDGLMKRYMGNICDIIRKNEVENTLKFLDRIHSTDEKGISITFLETIVEETERYQGSYLQQCKPRSSAQRRLFQPDNLPNANPLHFLGKHGGRVARPNGPQRRDYQHFDQQTKKDVSIASVHQADSRSTVQTKNSFGDLPFAKADVTFSICKIDQGPNHSNGQVAKYTKCRLQKNIHRTNQ